MHQMPDGHDGMMKDHARSGIAHHVFDALAHLGFVAVHRAVLAGGFVITEGAFFQAVICVFPELGTFLTERIGGVILAAVQADHRLHSISFLG